ncbi:MAG TPA: tetratricopeptide repeat protein [Pyrinomonadaceae bacterium]|jgi:tetratricopeptide (TPR) repeat protein
MQKIIIIFAVIILSSTVSAQMKMRDLQYASDDSSGSSPATPKADSTKAPDFVELNRQGVQKALVEKNYQQAAELFTKAIAAAPDCSRCKYNLGRTYLVLQKNDEGIRIFDELVRSDPNGFEFYGSLGELYSQKALYRESLPYYEKALKLNPKDPITLCNYAISLTLLEKHGAALENLDQAIKLQPEFTEAYSNRGYVLFLLGRPKDALESLQKAEKMNAALPEVHNNLGVVLERFGRKKEAKTHFEKAVELRPDYAEALCNLALRNLEDGNRDAAYRQLKALEKTDSRLAGQLRDVMWGKYVINASTFKED